MVCEEKRADDQRNEREELIERRLLVEDEPREKKCEKRSNARKSDRFGHRCAMQTFDPPQFRNTENENSTDEKKKERSIDVAKGGYAVEKVREYEKRWDRKQIPQEENRFAAREFARFLLIQVTYRRKHHREHIC